MKKTVLSQNYVPLVSLLIGLSFTLFICTIPVLASPTGPWWESDACWCDYPETSYWGHYHHCQDSEQTEFACALEDLNKSTHCQDNETNQQCSDATPPGIPIE